jgi:hypothetical protein
MDRNVPIQEKARFIGQWPARLDQELRKRYGDLLAPKTRFDQALKHYATEFNRDVLAGTEEAEVKAFIAGFEACIGMVVE